MRKAVKPILKIIAITVLVLAAVFFVNDKLKEIGNEISEQFLVDLIRKESNGLYELSFEKLELNLISNRLRIFNAQLVPNYKSITDSSTISNLYQVRIDSADINLKSVFKIYTKKELIVKGVEVVNPQILMTKINPEKKEIKLGRETGEIYEIISDYLSLLQIDYFQVRGGSLNHSPSKLSLNTINFGISDFVIDPSQKKRKVFYSESINLGLQNQSIDLPDSIHVLTFDGFRLSTTDSILSFTNLKIKARPHINTQESFTEKRKNIYDIIIPVLELKGINYLKAYQENHLLIDKVSIPEPIINIQSVSGTDNTESTSDNTIGKSLLALFDLIKVKNFKINEAALDLVVKIKNQQQFKSNNISIELFDIMLDSSNYEINSRTNYFENAKISIQDYDYKLPDSVHIMAFKNLTINTFNSTLRVEDFIINPSRNASDSLLTKFNFNIPLINLEGINYKEALIKKRMFLKSMEFTNPSIYVDPTTELGQTKMDSVFTPAKLQSVLKNYFEEIKADQIQVINGKVEISNQFFVDEISLKLEKLAIDTAVNSWHNLADSIYLQANHLQLKLKEGGLEIGHINAGRKLHELELEDLTYFEPKTETHIKSKKLKVHGVQLDSIIENSIVQIEKVSLHQPEFILHPNSNSDKEEDMNWKWPKKPMILNINDGKLIYHIDTSNYFSIGKFNTELVIQKQLSLRYFLSESLSVNHKALEHTLNIAKVNLPGNSTTLSIHNISLAPFEMNDSMKLSAHIPLVRLTGFNKETLIRNKNVLADSMIINVANMDMEWITKVQEKVSQTKDRKDENGFTIDLNTVQLELKQSTLQVVNSKNERSLWSNRKTTLLLQNLSYPTQKLASDGSLLYAKNFSFECSGLSGVSFTGDLLNFEHIAYNSKNRKGKINSFDIQKQGGTSSAKIENISLDNWAAQKYIESNEINIGSLTTHKADVFLTIKDSREDSFKNKYFIPFKNLFIRQIISKDLNLRVYHQEKDRNYFVRQADLKINRLNLDSAIYIKSLHRQLASLSFNGKDYREDIGKNYTLTADSYAFSYPNATLSASGIALKSRYDRFKFSQHIKYQTDWFDLKLASVNFSGINLDKLVNKELHIQKASINDGKFTVLRDLNVPLDTTKYVPLPQEALQKLKIPLQIDTVSVSAHINIYIVPKDGGGLGFVSFDELTGTIFGLRSRPASGQPIELFARGKLNKMGEFQAKAEFPFPSQKSKFTLSGSVGPMDISTLNEMLVPIAAVEVRSGENEQLNFELSGNNEYAEGNMIFRYNNLKVNILDRHTYQSSGLSNSLRTFFANSFVVRGKNPNLFKLNEGKIFFERNKSRSIFNYWSKSLLSGAVSSIGISNNEEDAKEYKEEEGVD
ncbi:hypothetical protein JKA74_09985 [Marivirga sp. S37H4]|uniref:Uncharacterized protein n=1 Tax=Marivirga aurantiaca TaxID=2802615 RepID=A0A934WY77_9BACT|nr:hypothetical protein [Marivirga aurantiaca]MBK6265368.1 hypothetical protein [Marivirga aurantiaca]